MNKKIIGNFIKTLREEKKLTQIQLSNAFGGIYSDALISRWETGKAVPNIDDLKALAKYFNVTVDEILNGTRNAETDFEKKYFIYNNDWLSQFNPDDLYNIREEQELLIETRFKELLKKMVCDGLSLSEDKEFDFIATHFYKLFLPAIECRDEKSYKSFKQGEFPMFDDVRHSVTECLPDDLIDIKFEIYKQTALAHNTTSEEKFWEANKKFIFTKRQNIWADICNVIEDAEDEVRKRISKLEYYEKDILLATLQQVGVVNTHAVGSSKGKELYEKKYGRKYDEEQLTKRAIKLLIECGAKLNKALLGYWKVITLKHTVADKLEYLHKKYKAPLLVPICEEGIYRYFTVNNTESNRAKLNIEYEPEIFDETDYSKLEARLYGGENIILKTYNLLVGGSDEDEFFIHARRQLSELPLEVYNAKRDDKTTKELLNNLGKLPLCAIREKYFPLEYRGEYIDDSHTLSSEELNKKYYIKETPNE